MVSEKNKKFAVTRALNVLKWYPKYKSKKRENLEKANIFYNLYKLKHSLSALKRNQNLLGKMKFIQFDK